MPTVEDARGQSVTTAKRPDRVVSLVPSMTESVARLCGARRLVGITKFCTEPEADVPAIRKVGGTKDPDVEAIVALQPDVVLANREENREEDVAALEAAGLPVFVGYPRTAREGVEELRTIARLLETTMVRATTDPIKEEIERQETLNADRPRVRVFCPIWRRPFMAVGGDTYAGDIIRLAGGENVFESHARGNRYPQVELSEVARADPAVILLPSEPFRFRRRHRQEMLDLTSIAASRNNRVFLVDGRWLSWYGHRTREGLEKLEELLDRARPDWKAPPRPVKQSKTAAERKKGSKVSGAKAFPGLEDAAKKAGARGKSRLTPEQRAAAKKRAAQRSGKASKARKAESKKPQRKPKTDVEMPPGLRLRVEQQEVVEEE
jgi:ABC-type Fe3+-hydroxamate transport system substrate-binding protein